MYYKCVKFHKNPIGGLGGVALTRYMDGRTDRRTDMVIPIYPPQTLFAGGIITGYQKNNRQHNGQKEKDKRTNNDLQNIIHKNKSDNRQK